MSKNSEQTQKDILSYLNGYINENGYPPSVREICSALNIKSTSTVHGYLKKLENEGIIERTSSKQRSIRINNDYKESNDNMVDVNREIGWNIR